MNGSPERSEYGHGRLEPAISAQIARAIAAVDSPDDVAHAVHEARRAIKRARALLGLATPLPRNSCAALALRDAGRALAGLRDADILVLTAQDLRDEDRDSELGAVPRPWLESLEGDRAHRFSESGSVDGPLLTADKLLRSVVVTDQDLRAPDTAVGLTEVPPGGVELMWLGLETSYAAVQARSDPTDGQGPEDERSHKLRKRVKDLRYQLEFLDTGHPELGGLVRDLHHLTDLLGDRNDLAVFTEAAATTHVLSEMERSALRACVEDKKQALGSEARALSARLFDEDVDSFVLRVAEWVVQPQG